MKHALILSAGLAVALAACGQKTEPAPVEAPAAAPATTGDMAALQSLPPAYQWEACSSAITEAGIGKRLGFGDAGQKVRAKWMAAAEAALDKISVTFATVDMKDLLGANGFLAIATGDEDIDLVDID